ncbi:MAG TPA: hypothetical protein VMJ92_02980 [Candidatus Limnocylindrales bacterium]|nr:hypothetical protein [Candidatus Limnocylindrales bacterium]
MSVALFSDPRDPAERGAAADPVAGAVQVVLEDLLGGVPHLAGAAVMPHPAEREPVAHAGLVPWLHDRRLTVLSLAGEPRPAGGGRGRSTADLPEDALPANRAVTLDWPLPYQAEWVGAAPRLLVARLVHEDRAVGVLLGTLTGREPLTLAWRETIDRSCEVVAAALVARPSNAEAREPDFYAEIRGAIEAAGDGRSLGRALRDAMNSITEASGFSTSLFDTEGQRVAYRYKVVGADDLSAQLGRQPVDDGPRCYAVRRGERWHVFGREVTDGDARRQVSVVQLPVWAGVEICGVVTLQTFRPEGFTGVELDLIGTVVEMASAPLALARALGRFQPTAEPELVGRVAPALSHEPSPLETAAAAALPPAAAAPSLDAASIVAGAIARCEAVGVETAFAVILEAGSGLLRGVATSRSASAAELDRALGITGGGLIIDADDRDNAIARACREARVLSVPTIHELVQPLREWSSTLVLERMVRGARSVVVPLVDAGDVRGAIVLGPSPEEADARVVEAVQTIAADAARELSAVSDDGEPSGVRLRLRALPSIA